MLDDKSERFGWSEKTMGRESGMSGEPACAQVDGQSVNSFMWSAVSHLAKKQNVCK